MDFKFSKGGEEKTQSEPAGEKKNQSAILVLLLLLVGGFAYVYFFTGIIRPQEAPKPAEAPAAAQVVKMPLPPREGDAGKADAKPADAKKETATATKAGTPKAPVAPVATVAPAAKTPASQPVPAKPKEEPKKAEPVKPKEEPKKAEVAKPKDEPKKAEPAKVADKKPVAEKKPEPAKPDTKKAAVEPKPKARPEKTVKVETRQGNSGSWSVLVGVYVLEDALSTDMGRVRKAGLDPVVKSGTTKKSAMNRLFLSDFADRAAASAALDKLKRHTSDAFIVEHSGKHSVYAGSYLLDARAASEKERLAAAGFPVSLKHAEVAIPTQSLTVGPFKDKKTADSALAKLKAAGVKATLSRQ